MRSPARTGVALVGGDTVRGPLVVTVQVLGFVPADARAAPRMAHARATLCTCRARPATRRRASSCCAAAGQRTPIRRSCGGTGMPSRGLRSASACAVSRRAAMDVSDGLLGDLGKLCDASGVGAIVNLERLPLSPALLASFDAASAERFALGGGDDYELLFTVPTAAAQEFETTLGAAGTITRIGEIVAGDGVRCQRAGRTVELGIAGYDHFARLRAERRVQRCVRCAIRCSFLRWVSAPASRPSRPVRRVHSSDSRAAVLVAQWGAWAAAATTAVVVVAGVWICGESARRLGVHDHPAIVWDEIAGMMITMLAAPPGWGWAALAFASVPSVRHLEALADPRDRSRNARRSGNYARRRNGRNSGRARPAARPLHNVNQPQPQHTNADVATATDACPGRSQTPERIGKYYVVHEVGRGSTGTVYLSHDPFYGRDVAIKLYHATTGDDAESRNARRMFMGEAQMIGKLQHPNIVPIYDAGEEDGRRYVVTEHVHGARTLSAYCRPGSLLPIDQVVGIVYKCAKALHYAHTRGVVHRDIKPSNILLTQDGDVRIVDFGIALVADSDVSRLEGVAGSPAYMSPEQVQGRELGPRSDLYSLGAVMYEMLCGPAPVSGRRARQAAQARSSTATPSRCAICDPRFPRSSTQLVRPRAREGSRTPLSQRRRARRGPDAHPPEAARSQPDPDRRAGTLRGAAQAALLPRFLPRRDPRGDARRGVAGLPARRARAAPRRHRRPLLRRRFRPRARRPRRPRTSAASRPAAVSARPRLRKARAATP